MSAFCKAEMSGSPSGLQAVPSAPVAPSIGATSCLRETSRGGGRRHPRIPFCSSGLQAGCGRTSECSTRQSGIQQQASAAQRVSGPARHLGALAVGVPTGCLQSVGLAQDVVALDPACRSLEKADTSRIARTGHFSFALTPLPPSKDDAPCKSRESLVDATTPNAALASEPKRTAMAREKNPSTLASCWSVTPLARFGSTQTLGVCAGETNGAPAPTLGRLRSSIKQSSAVPIRSEGQAGAVRCLTPSA